MVEYIGYIVAAIIAGMFGYLNVLSTRDSIVSNLREKWLENFREDSSNFLHKVTQITNNKLVIQRNFDEGIENNKKANDTHFTGKSYREVIAESHEVQNNQLSSAGELYQKIKLRLLSREKDESAIKEEDKLESMFQSVLQKVEELVNTYETEEATKVIGGIYHETEELEENLKNYINNEWRRIKGGEDDIRKKRRNVFAGVILAVIIYIIIILFNVDYKKSDIENRGQPNINIYLYNKM